MPLNNPALEYYNKIGASKHGKSLFEIIATLMLLIILILMINPAITHITKLNKENTDNRKIKVKLEEKLDNLEIARRNYADIEEDLPLLDLALPVGSDLPSYLKKIEELAAKNNLKVAAVQFSDVPISKPEKEVLKTEEMPYSITIAGSFPDFRTFLDDVEKYIRTTDVSTISITKDQSGQLKTTLGAVSYYFGIVFIPTDKKSNVSNTSSSGGNQ